MHDTVTLKIVEETGRHNETEVFQDTRHVSASEASWSILTYDTVDNDPSVYSLEVRTSRHHIVYFQEGQGLPAAFTEPQTKLAEWFKAFVKYTGPPYLTRFHSYSSTIAK